MPAFVIAGDIRAIMPHFAPGHYAKNLRLLVPL